MCPSSCIHKYSESTHGAPLRNTTVRRAGSEISTSHVVTMSGDDRQSREQIQLAIVPHDHIHLT
jgi:hypothetical protein